MENEKIKQTVSAILKSILPFFLLTLAFSCDTATTTYDTIEFYNETNDVVYAEFSIDNKETIKMSGKGSYSGFTIFVYPNNNNGINDSIFLNRVSNLAIFKIENEDTIYVNPVKYNSITKWTRHISYDMDKRYNQFILTLSSDFFE